MDNATRPIRRLRPRQRGLAASRCPVLPNAPVRSIIAAPGQHPKPDLNGVPATGVQAHLCMGLDLNPGRLATDSALRRCMRKRRKKSGSGSISCTTRSAPEGGIALRLCAGRRVGRLRGNRHGRRCEGQGEKRPSHVHATCRSGLNAGTIHDAPFRFSCHLKRCIPYSTPLRNELCRSHRI